MHSNRMRTTASVASLVGCPHTFHAVHTPLSTPPSIPPVRTPLSTPFPSVHDPTVLSHMPYLGACWVITFLQHYLFATSFVSGKN